WQVNNPGAATGNVPIIDSVYLSLDQVFDPHSDRYLGSTLHAGGLAAGANYTQSGSFPVPVGFAGTYYVFVVTNSNGSVYERNTANDAGYASQPVQIGLLPPADLVAGTVTIPASAVPGENITINYHVINNGPNAATGSWVDSLYLSPTQ